MSDSGDDLSTPANIPADSEIEQCLRRVVREAINKDEDITVNLARTRSEAKLRLDSGFFKSNGHWKQKSKELISAAVEEPQSPEQPKKSAPKPKAGTKRKSDEAQDERKKRVKRSPAICSDDDKISDEQKGEEPEQREAKVESKSGDESALSEPPDVESEPAAAKENGKLAVDDDDESDMSSVIDDPPPKKKGRQKKSSSPTATSKTNKSAKPAKATEKPAKDLSPEEEEIKRLQSWLLKCGVRKLWHRELVSYSTSKEKITHLNKMLDDVGMTGRFSAEKARSIKEARELKAELESAKEFNDQWGHEEDEDAADTGLRRGLKPKGLVDFGDSDEQSE